MERQTQRIAMPNRVEFRPVSRPPDERVVRRNGSVVFQAKDLADIRAGFLRLLPIVSIPAGHIKVSCLVERDTRTVTAVRWSLAATALRNPAATVIGLG